MNEGTQHIVILSSDNVAPNDVTNNLLRVRTTGEEAYDSFKRAILKADRSLFGRMIVIAQSWQLNMRVIFVHPLGPIPWALDTQ